MIRNLNETGLQISLIVGADGVLMGTVTDGDIRRGMLRGLTLDSAAETIVWREPLVAPSQLRRDTVLQLMQLNKVHQMPVVDERRRVIGLHVWDDLMSPAPRAASMVIMAGGKGTRLGAQTENCPKPLLRVSGKPMLEHIIEQAHAEGFQHFVLAVHYLASMIEDYFGDGSRWGVQIEYLHEDQPLGTAGALGLLTPRPPAPFLVTNGDVLTDVRYAELYDFHNRHAAAATMAVRQHEWQHPFGVVKTDGVDIVALEEKPIARTHINAGIYVLDPSVLDLVDGRQHCDMPSLFVKLQERGARTIAYPMHEPWLDIGRPDDLERASRPQSRTKP